MIVRQFISWIRTASAGERTILWNDPALGIRWPLQGEPILAEKDRRGTPLQHAELA